MGHDFYRAFGCWRFRTMAERFPVIGVCPLRSPSQTDITDTDDRSHCPDATREFTALSWSRSKPIGNGEKPQTPDPVRIQVRPLRFRDPSRSRLGDPTVSGRGCHLPKSDVFSFCRRTAGVLSSWSLCVDHDLLAAPTCLLPVVYCSGMLTANKLLRDKSNTCP